ncbi:hypothetical protein [Desulfobacula sp.]|uniref:hypothetical protein n=1 Tax=Desulfobacula sp. TaxID=2593537 RepID=UPI002634DA55|nr:hypothetical protein [Desulfobacula sp.]
MNKFKQKKIVSIYIILLSMLFIPLVHGNVDLTPIQKKTLAVQPLDVASSEDGQMIFILSPGELSVYSLENDKILSRSAIDDTYDNITYSEKNKTLILTGHSSKLLEIIRVEQVFEISLSGLPFKGHPDAPVTIAVFDDYQ